MKPTVFRAPRSGDTLLRVQFRNGLTRAYVARQLRWTDTGHDFDVVAFERAA